MSRDLTEDLKDHPSTKELQFAGETFHFAFGKRGFDLARERGTDIGEVLSGLDGVDEEALENGHYDDIDGLMDTLADILWVGFLPFEPDLEREWVHGMMTVADMRAISDEVSAAISVNAEMPEAKKND